MGFFANINSEIKVFPDHNAEDLYLNALPKVRFNPGDIITFKSEFIRDLVYRHHIFSMHSRSFPEKSPETIYETIYRDSITKMNYNEAQNIVSVLKTITSNIYEYLATDQNPDSYIPKISPVICEKYNDVDWTVLGGVNKRCLQCAFLGPPNDRGNSKSRICDRLDCDGIIFKKYE